MPAARERASGSRPARSTAPPSKRTRSRSTRASSATSPTARSSFRADAPAIDCDSEDSDDDDDEEDDDDSDDKDEVSDDGDNEDEAANAAARRIDAQRRRLRPSAINSITGETNREVVAAIESAHHLITSKALVAKVRALGLLNRHGDVKPMARWTHEQRSAAVKLWRVLGTKTCDVRAYGGDRGAWKGDMQIVLDVEGMLSEEADVNAEMSLHFD